jgi:hypothetical protein
MAAKKQVWVPTEMSERCLLGELGRGGLGGPGVGAVWKWELRCVGGVHVLVVGYLYVLKVELWLVGN